MWAYVPLHCIMGECSTVSLYYGKYLCVSSVGKVPQSVSWRSRKHFCILGAEKLNFIAKEI